MQKFITKLIWFSLILVPTYLTIGKLQKIIVTNNLYSVNTFKLDKKTEIVFIGDSHSMCSFDDSIIPNSFNASRNSESYFQSFNKLNSIIRYNSQIKYVVLSFSPHNLSKRSDDLVLYSDRYYPILDDESKSIIENPQNKNISKFNRGLFNTVKKIAHYAKFYYLELKWEWGLPYNLNEALDYFASKNIYNHPVFTKPHFSNYSALDKEIIQKSINRHFNEKCNFSETMQNYLNKIILLCINNNKHILLVNTPLNHRYKKEIPLCQVSNYNNFVKNNLINQNQITFYDFSDFQINDSLFGDGDHLNSTGKIVFSKYFVDYLKKHN